MNYENVLSSAERQTQYEHELQRMGVPALAGIGPNGPKPPAERLVHLDLKGAAPKVSLCKIIMHEKFLIVFVLVNIFKALAANA